MKKKVYKDTKKDTKERNKIQKDTKSKDLLKALQLGIEPRSPAQLPP